MGQSDLTKSNQEIRWHLLAIALPVPYGSPVRTIRGRKPNDRRIQDVKNSTAVSNPCACSFGAHGGRNHRCAGYLHVNQQPDRLACWEVLSAAFKVVETAFTTANPCVTVTDKSAGSLDMIRLVTAGGQPAEHRCPCRLPGYRPLPQAPWLCELQHPDRPRQDGVGLLSGRGNSYR